MQDEGARGRCDVRVLIAENQPIVREGFGLFLEAVEGFEVVGCVDNCDDLLRGVRDWAPAVVLLDMRLGDEEGAVVTQRVKFCHPGVGVLLFPTEIREEQLDRVLKCGANGVIRKRAPVLEVLEAIIRVAEGGFVLGRDLVTTTEVSFSPREREVLRLLAAGLGNREISQSLFISLSTTKSHLESIARKLGTSSRAAAATEAIRRGVVA